MDNYIRYEVWSEITYQFLNSNGFTIKFREWINNCIPRVLGLELLINVVI